VTRQPSRQFQQTLWEIQKRWGNQALVSASTLSKARTLPTGFEALDQMLSIGGLACGHITEWAGMPTSGMTTLMCRVMANAQTARWPILYLDLSQTFDPHYAWRCGVDLEMLLTAEPKNAVEGFELVRDVVSVARPMLIIVDAMLPLSYSPALSTVLKRLQQSLLKSGAVVSVLLPRSPHRWLDTYTHTVLHVEREAWRYQHGDVAGYRVRVTLAKDKLTSSTLQASFDLDLDPAVDGL
jgi:hypothetical protein